MMNTQALAKFSRVLLLSTLVFGISGSAARSGSDLRLKIEAYLQHIGKPWLEATAREELSQVRFGISATHEIEAVLIWTAEGRLLFPQINGVRHYSEDSYLNSERYLFKAASQTSSSAWIRFDTSPHHFNYCRSNPTPHCFLVSVGALNTKLGVSEGRVESELFGHGQSLEFSAWTLFLALAFFIAHGLYGKKVTRHQDQQHFAFANILIDPKTLSVLNQNQQLLITQRDLKILQYFVERPNEVISKKTLYAAVWQQRYTPGSRALDQHIQVLRRKLSLDSKSAQTIETIHGVGYRYRTRARRIPPLFCKILAFFEFLLRAKK